MTEEKRYSIGEFAKLTGVTERTLRYYDRPGLLKPLAYTKNGHREYDSQSIAQLQKILVLKFLDLSLSEISEQLGQPEQDLSETLAAQAAMLEEKRRQIETVLQTIARVQKIVSEAEAVNPDVLLVLIHALKNEEERRRWLEEHADGSVHHKLHAYTSEFELDKEMTEWTSKMKQFIREEKTPDDPEVLSHTDAMVQHMKLGVEPLLDDEAKKQLMDGTGSFEEPDPYLFPSAFSKEEEQFMERVLEELISSKINRAPRE